MEASRRSIRSVAPVGALLVCALPASACQGAKKAGAAERSLASCGLAYQVPDGWTATDPSTQPAYTFPAIGPKASVAELDAPDGTHVVVQCVARWSKATTTTCDQATTAVGFDEYVARCHDFYAGGPLSSAVSRDELALGDGGTLAFTTAHLARGLACRRWRRRVRRRTRQR
jgi:hypothetical protein